ncbi:MAG: nucleotidyltransferase domain-containing protein [Deltaproteobacteria bacterium]|nr:nucleotidyltransferase domain-containing protein [Deltaproteobacteria bacterium]
MGASDSSILDEIVRRIVAVADPDRVVLFGSRARGDASPDSDRDFLVVKAGVPHRRKLAQDIYLGLLGVPAAVEVMVFRPEDLEAERDCPWSVVPLAMSEGKLVHAR